MLEDQGEKQIIAIEEHEKQPVKYSDEKEPSTNLKQKEISEKIANRRIE